MKVYKPTYQTYQNATQFTNYILFSFLVVLPMKVYKPT